MSDVLMSAGCKNSFTDSDILFRVWFGRFVIVVDAKVSIKVNPYAESQLMMQICWLELDVGGIGSNASNNINGGNRTGSGIFSNIFEPKSGSWLQLSNLLSQFGGLGSGGLGENGRAVHLPANLMADAKAKFQIHQFDVVVSDLISVNRSLSDRRNSRCLSQNYEKEAAASGLNSSIIIVFHNEAWSTLLRTVHSVLNRTPPNLLHEILLVDDASDKGIFRMISKMLMLENALYWLRHPAIASMSTGPNEMERRVHVQQDFKANAIIPFRERNVNRQVYDKLGGEITLDVYCVL
ncbi:unnamed protein product [Dibothriocephalus latus]|uniref:Glycosyltransferase 2-like domain-containing protein n=1 Tax=Dibothriocephalus latus TaxID=60516 RepID=A0A3P6UHW7_DIBLA|nr:unnamed protein product [Dibothriocephalus latus]